MKREVIQSEYLLYVFINRAPERQNGTEILFENKD